MKTIKMAERESLKVGVFHRDEANRKALIGLLNKQYNCVEIERWEEVESADVDTLVLDSPELLYPGISFEEMIEVIESHKASILLINNDNRKWWVYRSNYEQLRKPSVEMVKMKLKQLKNPLRMGATFFQANARA